MSALPDLLDDVRSATARLVTSVERLGPGDVSAASLLPGWTRAHLLTHIARNADGARNLLLALRSGQPVRMYVSPGLREADISAGAGRPVDVILADAIESSRRFVLDAESTPLDLWDTELSSGTGSSGPTDGTMPLRMRLREVEFHHVDLAVGYGFRSTPEPLVDQLLEDAVRRLATKGVVVRGSEAPDGPNWTVEDRGGTVPVSGPPADLLAWLSGRSPGDGLGSPGPLPAVPSLD